MAQRSSTTAFAKSTRPEITGVVRRESLFSRLDGTPARTVAWISAPPGFGKTTLAASYLEARGYRWAWYEVDPDDDDGETFLHYLAHTMRRLRTDGEDLPAFGPEHRADLAAFARRFFRILFSGAVGPIALVLDNLHDLTLESPLRAILDAGLPQVPRQCCVIVTSRAAPPVTLSRLQLADQMVYLGAEDLRITPSELAEMAALRGCPLAPDALLRLHQRADGWAAALVLMVEHGKLASDSARVPGEATPKAVFDYLAGEIFERFEPATQRFLLQIACLPRVTIEVARALSGDEAAPRVLFNLAHNDYFVRELVGQDGRVFVFHPLLREFLLHRAARDLPHAVGPDALRRAALLLREAGQPEEALALLIECKDWPAVAAVALQHADALMAQGRHATLAAWLELLPPQLLGGDGTLLHAHGMALAHASPRVARRRFEEAFLVFQRGADAQGMVRCCLGVIDAMLQEFDDLTGLDHWLAEFDRCRSMAHDETDLPAAVLVARLWRDPRHPAVTPMAYASHGERSVRNDLARSIAAALRGDFAHSATIAKGVEAAAGLTRLALAASDALRRLLEGDAVTALEVARQGLSISAGEAIKGFDVWLRMLCIAAELALGETEEARNDLNAVEEQASRRGDRAFVHYLRGCLARVAAEEGAALRESRNAARLALEAGLPWLECLSRIAMAQALGAAGDRHGAEAQLRGAEALALRLGSALLQLAALLAQAAVAIEFVDEEAATAPLRTGLALARDLGVHHVPGLPAALMGTLCAASLRRGIAVDHTRLLITAGRLAPPPAALRLRRWPWAFEVTTLGGFGLQRAGVPVEFSAKGPGRPVELLKVLISLGGRNVRADQLADALWPHVDADYAHKSFTATLHRLRRIFGSDDTLRLSDGRLSLNDSLFWLDTWALDHLLGEIDNCLRADDARVANQALSGLVEEVLVLYQGPFLPDEAEQPTYIARREQLRARMLRALTRVGRRWEESEQSDAAVDCYLRSIDADELCESFYRNLMLCYQRHGDVAEALATYDRLQAVLAARLKSVPSPETKAIRDGLRP
jgi:LuxR family maltose regulon positive regulatory protein